ncbi:MAG: glycosyl transferase [Candidatus Cloacimonadia bacterium]
MKRVLIISFYFPPCGGASVQRWLRFIKHLPNLGWQPTILTASESDYSVLDPTLAHKVPLSTKVIRTKRSLSSKLFSFVKPKSNDEFPYGTLLSQKDDPLIKKLLYWTRLNIVTPDSRVFWSKAAYNLAKEELRSKKYSLIITTGPPHSSHLVGMKLKESTPLPWIADFRDPWTDIYYLQTAKQNPIIKEINKELEKSVLKKADAAIIISKPIADSLPKGNKHVLVNGFEEEDFLDIKRTKSSFFRIKYVGKLTEGQDIKAPLRWLSEYCKQDEKKNITFSLVGTNFQNAKDIQRKHPCFHLRTTPQLSHREAINEMVNSELLLLLINQCPHNKGILTTKFFEYIAARPYIIAIGPKESEVAKYLSEYKAGEIIDYQDKMGFISVVKQKYEQWASGELQRNESDISSLSAEEQTKELVNIFNSVIEREEL